MLNKTINKSRTNIHVIEKQNQSRKSQRKQTKKIILSIKIVYSHVVKILKFLSPLMLIRKRKENNMPLGLIVYLSRQFSVTFHDGLLDNTCIF